MFLALGHSSFAFPACRRTRPASGSNFNFKTKFLEISQIVERLTSLTFRQSRKLGSK